MGKISSFITGATLGAGIALLLAPKTGEQARAYVAEKANAVMGEAKDFSEGVPASVQDLTKTAKEAASAVVGDAAARVKEATGQAVAPSAADDELREKIEAARKRIAAQVMENAEQTKPLNVEPAAE